MKYPSIATWLTSLGSPSIQVTLHLSYEYLRLYTNAFAFQATISQSLASKINGDDHAQREHLRRAFNNVASLQDARFIYESVDAAKAYLTILVDAVDPEKHLHFMPLRFYLYVPLWNSHSSSNVPSRYGIYAAVFLYKVSLFTAYSGLN